MDFFWVCRVCWWEVVSLMVLVPVCVECYLAVVLLFDVSKECCVAKIPLSAGAEILATTLLALIL